MTKRTFFKSFMGIVATVSLAPELAFGRLKMPVIEPTTLKHGAMYWDRDGLAWFQLVDGTWTTLR